MLCARGRLHADRIFRRGLTSRRAPSNIAHGVSRPVRFINTWLRMLTHSAVKCAQYCGFAELAVFLPQSIAACQHCLLVMVRMRFAVSGNARPQLDSANREGLIVRASIARRAGRALELLRIAIDEMGGGRARSSGRAATPSATPHPPPLGHQPDRSRRPDLRLDSRSMAATASETCRSVGQQRPQTRTLSKGGRADQGPRRSVMLTATRR
jgi:hypothetical protein